MSLLYLTRISLVLLKWRANDIFHLNNKFDLLAQKVLCIIKTFKWHKKSLWMNKFAAETEVRHQIRWISYYRTFLSMTTMLDMTSPSDRLQRVWDQFFFFFFLGRFKKDGSLKIEVSAICCSPWCWWRWHFLIHTTVGVSQRVWTPSNGCLLWPPT